MEENVGLFDQAVVSASARIRKIESDQNEDIHLISVFMFNLLKCNGPGPRITMPT